MLLFQKRFHQGLVDGSTTLTFRRWDKLRVKPGGRYRCHPIGVLEVDSVDRVNVAGVTEADAKRAGFGSRAELLEYIGAGDEVVRIAFRHVGDGDRISLAMEADLTAEDVATIRAKLARMDKPRRWTAKTLALIGNRPRTAASKLAAELGRETLPFKADVVKLKKLGLTQSFEVGYELSPRGRAYLARR